MSHTTSAYEDDIKISTTMAKTEKMQIRFESNEHQIDSNTLINYLIHYNAVVAEVNNAYGKGEKKISVKVNALKEGSFVIDLSLLEETIVSLFSRDNIEYLAEMITIVGGVYGAYKVLRGRPVKTKEDRDSISTTFYQINQQQNTQINQTIVYVYNNRSVREAISKSFTTVEEDETVTGVEISSEVRGQSVKFGRDEFPTLQYNDFEHEDDVPQRIAEVVEARLTIISLNFERGNRWQFMYNGFKIAMTVKDDALMERIEQGARFGKGDSIRVKMRIIKEYNKSYKAYENKSYRIVEFLEHIMSPSQGNLFG